MKFFYSLLIIVILVLISGTFVKAQGTISGIVSDKNSGTPFEAATLILRNKQTNAIEKKGRSDKEGAFLFSNIIFGRYFLEVVSLGYSDFISAEIVLDGQHTMASLNLGMTANQNELKEVVVTAKKQLFSNSIDRKVYNVSQDIMSKSGTVSEILQNVPLVQVDIDGNVSLRNSNVTILINGKTNPLMGKNQAVVLQQLPANSIERIEVITNPSAKYKPDGQGGIINIVLKKDTSLGFNGNVTLNAGNDERYNASLFLNYNPKKVNIFGSYSIRQDDRHRYSTNLRNQRVPTGFFFDILTAVSRPFANIASAGIDFTPTDKNRFGISGNYYLRSMNKHDITDKIINAAGQNENYNRKLVNHEEEIESEATVYFEHSFKKEDHLLRLEINSSNSPETEDNHFRNLYTFPVRSDSLDNTLIKQTSNDQQVTLSYQNPINEDTKLELGYDGQFNKEDFDFF